MKEKVRQLLHSRTVFSQGFLRNDGLIDSKKKELTDDDMKFICDGIKKVLL